MSDDQRPPGGPGGSAPPPASERDAARAAADGTTTAAADEREAGDEADAELEALLERGYAALESGDLDEAERAAQAADDLFEESPEAHALFGAISAARGDYEAAIASFEHAMQIEPDYVDPYLQAADVYLYALGQPDEAARLCDAALDAAEDEEDYLDALLLKCEALLEADDEAGARAAIAELPPSRLPAPGYDLRAGHLLLDLGDLAAAERHFLAAEGAAEPGLEGDALRADTRHALALLHEARGETRKMVDAFLAVRKADLAAPPPSWGVTRERFEQLAEEAMADLPERIRELIANVPILAADYPAIELVAEGNDPRMMGFFSGVPYPEKPSMGEGAPHLDCIFLYQRNIERVGRTTVEVEAEIRKTIFHETGHFFGLSEEELESMGLG